MAKRKNTFLAKHGYSRVRLSSYARGTKWRDGVAVIWNTEALQEIMGLPQEMLEGLAKDAAAIAKTTAPVLTEGKLSRPGHESGRLRDSIGWAPWKEGGAYIFTATGGDGPNDKGYGAIVELGSKSRGIAPSGFMRKAIDAAILRVTSSWRAAA